MSKRPARCCPKLGCKGYLPAGGGGCTVCSEGRRTASTSGRAPWYAQHRKWYESRRWRAVKKRFLQAHPFCVECAAEGFPEELANTVDHIVPARGDRHLFWNSSNWQPLCRRHHNVKSARERAQYQKRGG